MEKSKHFLWYQLPAIAWAAAIFIQSSMADISVPELGFDWQDKVYHAIEYGILGFLLYRALFFQKIQLLKTHASGFTWLLGSLYAISDEIHQYFVPGRSADVGDALADVAGITLILLLLYLGRLFKIRQPKANKLAKFQWEQTP
ncbi:MAG: VanZ family protein [candidate division KSB1 bacterium]|nr:VanZ family protein [candidate division KSB1 bacterium]